MFGEGKPKSHYLACNPLNQTQPLQFDKRIVLIFVRFLANSYENDCKAPPALCAVLRVSCPVGDGHVMHARRAYRSWTNDVEIRKLSILTNE